MTISIQAFNPINNWQNTEHNENQIEINTCINCLQSYYNY